MRPDRFSFVSFVSIGLLVITLSSIVNAQPRAKQQPANSPSETDAKHDTKLAIYQVHRLGEKILALRSVRAKAFEVARLASVLWKHDETHARFLFENSKHGRMFP